LFYIKPDYGILIQESDYSDSNIARFQRSGELPATFATQSAHLYRSPRCINSTGVEGQADIERTSSIGRK
ncbi:MAG: hypothetical protein ACLQJ0_04105, partial [Steroidobacteraceae bacterium]